MSTEAMKLALEALERLHYEQYTHQGEQAITALQEALAQHSRSRSLWLGCTPTQSGTFTLGRIRKTKR